MAKRPGHLEGPIGEKLPVRSNKGIRAAPSRTTAISSRFSKARTRSAAREMDFLVKGIMIGVCPDCCAGRVFRNRGKGLHCQP